VVALGLTGSGCADPATPLDPSGGLGPSTTDSDSPSSTSSTEPRGTTEDSAGQDTGAVDGSTTTTAGDSGDGDSSTGSTASCEAVPDWWAGERDITFVAFGDTQTVVHDEACDISGKFRDDQNALIIEAINGIESVAWDGRPVANVRGVLVAGDITQNGNGVDRKRRVPCPEFAVFEDAFGLCGEADLRFPVYEGYGNHDFPFRPQFDDVHPVLDLIEARTPDRPGLTSYTPGTGRGHYAWRWDDIDFINLNAKPTGTATDPAYADVENDKGRRRVDPHAALDYLETFLSTVPPAGPVHRVVLMTHYGPSNGNKITPQQREALCDVLVEHDVDVIAWLHGHTHKSDTYTWQCPNGGPSMPVFNVGSPFYGVDQNEGQLHFSLFRIRDHEMRAVDISVSPDDPTTYSIPGLATPNDNMRGEYDPDGVWGGWSFVGDVTPP